MLNRTNRTLSASRNRLNLGLGTRSLASLARVSFNDGNQTLHTRHVYPVVMRAGMVGDPVDPISIGRYGIPSIPGSPSVSPWLITSYAIRPRVDFATGLPSTGDWQVHSLGQNILFADGHAQWFKGYDTNAMTFRYDSMHGWE